MVRKQGWLIALCLLSGLISGLGASPAEQEKAAVELRGGVLAHDVDHLWSNLHVEGGVDLNLEMVLFVPARPILSGRICPNLGITVDKRWTSGDRCCCVAQVAKNDLGDGNYTYCDMLAIYEVNDAGLITRMAAHWDFDAVMEQIKQVQAG